MTVDLMFESMVTMRYAIFYVFNPCQDGRKANAYGIVPGAKIKYDFPNLTAAVEVEHSDSPIRYRIFGLKNGTYPRRLTIVRASEAA